MEFEIVEGGLKETSSDTSNLKLAARGPVAAAQAATGYVGDLSSLLFDASSFLSGRRLPNYEQAQEKLSQNVPFEEDADIQFMTPRLPATTEQVEKVVGEQTGDYFKPQNEYERRYDSLVKDVTHLVMPGGALPFKKAFKVAGIGNTAAEVARQLGSDESGESLAKFGGVLVGNLLGGRKYLRDLYNKNYAMADKAAKGALVKVPELKKTTEKVLTNLYSGSKNVPWKNTVKDITEDVYRKIVSDEIKVPDLIELKQDLNDLLRTTKIPARGKKIITDLRNSFNSSLKKYGEINPEFGKSWQNAEQLYAGINADNALQSFIKKHPNLKKIASHPVTLGLSLGGSLYQGGIPMVGAEIAGLGALNYGLDQLKLLTTSPLAFKEYTKMIGAALKDNVKTYKNSVGKLDKIVRNHEKKKVVSPKSKMNDFEVIEGGLR